VTQVTKTADRRLRGRYQRPGVAERDVTGYGTYQQL